MQLKLLSSKFKSYFYRYNYQRCYFMQTIKNETILLGRLNNIDKKIDTLNTEKIKAFFKAIDLDTDDLPENYTEWETILIVVPNRTAMNELKPYKYSIDRIAFAININAEKIHVFNLDDWKKAFRHKTQLQIRNLLKTSFGGVKRTNEHFTKDTDGTTNQ
jgi:hypothetical protein